MLLAAFTLLESAAYTGSEIRAVWLTTLDGLDWPHTRAVDNATMLRQQRELTALLDTLRLAGINTVLLQVRVRGTVIYPSAIEPWDACLTGTGGKNPGYDPLRFAIDEAHKRGMELHAWVVTTKAGPWGSFGCRSLRRKYPKVMKRVGNDGYMNPEVPQTGDIIASVCAEIARNYDVDGIHLDFIRYPDGWRMKVSRQQGRANITSIVRKIHDSVKAVDPSIKMSCSPIGKYRDLSLYSSGGWNAYNSGCQEAQAWLRDGLMDQLYPMMYFRGNQFFPFALDWMEHSYGRDVIAGIGAYFLDKRYGKWKIDEVKRQINVAASLGMGICFFRAQFLVNNVQGLYEYMRYEHDYAPMIINARNAGYDDETAAADEPAVAPAGPERLNNDGEYMCLPDKGSTLDADYIIIETLQGHAVATLPYRGDKANISSVPDGCYFVRSLGRKGRSHRLGFTIIKR